MRKKRALSTGVVIQPSSNTCLRLRCLVPSRRQMKDIKRSEPLQKCEECLACPDQICYIKDRKGTTAKVVDLVEKVIYRITTPTRQSSGVVFLCLKHYLINVNTNVSNARMNIPKAIRSLKSNGFLSISTTPILCRIEVSHPVTRLLRRESIA